MAIARGVREAWSNPGAAAIDSFTPIINAPQIGILGVTKIREIPVVTHLQGILPFELACHIPPEFLTKSWPFGVARSASPDLRQSHRSAHFDG